MENEDLICRIRTLLVELYVMSTVEYDALLRYVEESGEDEDIKWELLDTLENAKDKYHVCRQYVTKKMVKEIRECDASVLAELLRNL